jgi:hypothetical protein
MRDIWAGVTDVSIHFPHDSNMFITVEQRVFLLSGSTSSTPMSSPIRLETCIRQHDDQSLRVFVVCWNGNMLLRDKSRQFGRRERLGSCRRAPG